MATVVPFQAQPEGIDLVQLAYLEWLESQENERASKYTTFRDYYEGEHLTQLTDRVRKFLELKPDQEFSLNFCPIVVDSLAEKLKVQRFECPKQPAQEEQFAEWWEASRMDAQQGVVHLGGIRDGDTYVLVEWDNEKGLPVYTQENAYDGSQGMHVVYSDEHRIVPIVAIKRWTVTSGINVKTRRTNLYYADRVEKYSDQGTGNTWTPFYDEEAPEEWPRPWTDETGRPLGIPVVHFRNKDQGYSYGESELEDVVPMSNALNKTVIDLLAAADSTGFQMVTATGHNGNESPLTVAPGQLLWSANPDAKFGSINAAALGDLIALKDSVAIDIARITRTPMSSFQITGQVAAAGTLKEQRSGLIAKARDRQTTFGNSWEDVQAIARRLFNAFGPGSLDESKRIATCWEDDEKPDPKELAATVETAHRAGAMSTKTKVETLHPEWDAKQVEEEVRLIQDEQGLMLTDIGPTTEVAPNGEAQDPLTPDEQAAAGLE